MDEWHGKWKSDGGVTNQQAIHHIDVARWLFGPVKEVNSLMTNQINRLQAEDTNNTLIRYKNGAIGTVQLTTSVRPKDMQASIEVIGEKGFMVLGGIALNKIDKYFFKNLTSDEKKNLPVLVVLRVDAVRVVVHAHARDLAWAQTWGNLQIALRFSAHNSEITSNTQNKAK